MRTRLTWPDSELRAQTTVTSAHVPLPIQRFLPSSIQPPAPGEHAAAAASKQGSMKKVSTLHQTRCLQGQVVRHNPAAQPCHSSHLAPWSQYTAGPMHHCHTQALSEPSSHRIPGVPWVAATPPSAAQSPGVTGNRTALVMCQLKGR